ncbi:MAG TPA: diguanylate cyclase [Candidatus Binatia bacterium]|nr:diguanylate cyclase [Candidatus Binatia bacterium]
MEQPGKVTAKDDGRAGISSARWFRMLDTASPTGLAVIDLDGKVILANRFLIDLGGYDPTGPNLSLLDCIVANERANVKSVFERVRAGETVRFETLFRHLFGGSTPIGVTIYPLYRRKRIVAVGVRVHDRSQFREAEERRLENRESLRLRQLYLVAASAGRTPAQQIQALLELGNEIFKTDAAYINEIDGEEVVALYVTGSGARRGPGHRRKLEESFTKYALKTKSVVAVDNIDLSPWRDSPVHASLSWTGAISVPVERFGKVYATMVFATNAPGGHHFSESDKELVHLMAALCGSTLERLAHEERLGALAFYDALTGLPNRVLFDDRVEQTLVAARRHEQKFAIVFFDLDDFKDVNDMYGHAAGDELLRVVAHRLQAVARESDTFARHGGDEFVALQRFVRSPQDAMRMARRVNETLRQPAAINGVVLTVSASIGVALYPDHGTTASELLAHADAALYRAKNSGRDCAVLYQELVPATS